MTNDMKLRQQQDENEAATVAAIKYLEFVTHNLEASDGEILAETGITRQEAKTLLAGPYIADQLATMKDPLTAYAQKLAIERLPEVVEAMAKIATGKLRMTGMNPQAAAEFVLKVAESGQQAKSEHNQQINIFVPEIKKPDADLSQRPVIEVVNG